MDISRDANALRALLTSARRIAVVGCSPSPDRDSHSVTKYLIDAGYEVHPVNPQHPEILGRKSYPDLRSVPGPIDIVDVFRRPDAVPAIVAEAIALGARAIWMQLGAGHAEAATRASEAGLTVVVEQCIRTAHQILMRKPRR